MNYYSTIHTLELIYIISILNRINVAETVDIVQLSAIALQISRQIFDYNAGIYTHLLCLLCAKTTFHHLTLLCGIADVTNAAK